MDLYITCKNPACRRRRWVKTPYEQKIRQYCGRRCAEACWTLSKEAMSRGGTNSAIKRRARMLQLVAKLTPIEAFKAGYVRGVQSKWRKAKARAAA